MLSENRLPNSLIDEISPYLIQHAYNPVNWQPWGEEAFERAKAEDKPVFISIGYSTCHWCHVMAHETFEDRLTAEMLNNYFIPIKVDREERPDVDSFYMTACQAFTGAGGWPLSVFADCGKKPFFAGTYFPNEVFNNLLSQIINLWDSGRDELNEQSVRITDILKNGKPPEYVALSGVTERAFDFLSVNFDPEYGGFSSAPKFPSPHNLLFLLKHYKLYNDYGSLSMCEKTLKAMRAGGIYDHIGGGFSRYSTDKLWLVPHFEKMLYDNASLLQAYIACYEITRDNFYSDTAAEIIEYLMRDMRSPMGAFYTAEDADSEGREGLFYTFTYNEITDILKGDADEFRSYYNITKKGNFEGRNILNTIGQNNIGRGGFTKDCLKKLFKHRSLRVRPHRDEKIMASYNGLIISALASAGRILQNTEYIHAAETAAAFITDRLTAVNGRLISFYLGTPSKYEGFAEDYAFCITGFLDLYEAAREEKYLSQAVKLQEIFTREFFDFENGGFYLSGNNGEELITRTKELYDGAIPSYNSAALHNLYRLYKITGDTGYMKQYIKTLVYFSGDIAAFPQGYIHTISSITALMFNLPYIQICTGNVCRPPAKDLEEFIGYF